MGFFIRRSDTIHIENFGIAHAPLRRRYHPSFIPGRRFDKPSGRPASRGRTAIDRRGYKCMDGHAMVRSANNANPPETDRTASPKAPAPGRGAASNPNVKTAARQLADTAANGQAVDAICLAYQTLRNAADPGDIDHPLHFNGLVAPRTRQAVCDAYARRKCLMCNGQAETCEACEGTGQADGEPCGPCEGLGVVICQFCQGSGWAELSTVPAELRDEVRKRRRDLVGREVSKFLQNTKGLSAQALGRLPRARQVSLLVWMQQLHARLDEVLAANGRAHSPRTDRLRRADKGLARLVESLRRQVTR
jgi:hypothetical protein